MALTKEFEYDCEVRGPYKAVQVRKATIIRMATTRLTAPITGTFCNATKSGVLGAIPTSAVKTHLSKLCATLCGPLQSNLLMRHLRTARRYRCADGNVIDDGVEHSANAGHRTGVFYFSFHAGKIKRIDILLNRTREDYATRTELKEDMQQVLQALHRVEDKLDRALGRSQ